MRKIINKIKWLFNLYKVGLVCSVKVSDIIIPKHFQAVVPRAQKMNKKRAFYKKYDVYESKVILNKDFMLLDGYTTYLLCIENGDKYVDVYFVD